jgi:excinuclease ABC subunit C
VSLLREKILNLPAQPGVYLFKDAHGRVIYVGKAQRLAHRVRGYLAGDNDPFHVELMEEAADLDVILTDSEVEALLLESTLIRQHHPRFNIRLKDDKSFPYVRVSVQEEWPRLSVTRQVRSDGARYLGPFTDVKLLRRTLREVRRIFPVRTCRNFEDYRRADRPCLYYHIHRCVGPCYSRAAVRHEDYRALVDGLLLFLTGRDQELLQTLRTEMDTAALERRYEMAARRRDQIRLLERVRSPQKVVKRTGARDADVVGIARHGARAAAVVLLVRAGRVVGKESRILERAEGGDEAEILASFLTQHYLPQTTLPRRLVLGVALAEAPLIAEALGRRAGHPVELALPSRGRERALVATAERNAAHALEDLEARAAGRRSRYAPEVVELQKALGLEAPPHRIVCFDVSNLGGDQAVAAAVASENGQMRKGLYRRMRIRHPGPDDFAMMGEVVERYWTRVESGELPRPDLVVVDGGIGQIGAARRALDRASTRPVPIIGLAKREETVMRERGQPLKLPRRSPSLRLLQRLRDEAHRFGLTYHRTLRGRARVTSALDQVSGIGPSRRAALLRAFGSITALSGRSPEEIAARARVPLALATRVADALRGESPPSAPAADHEAHETPDGTGTSGHGEAA